MVLGIVSVPVSDIGSPPVFNFGFWILDFGLLLSDAFLGNRRCPWRSEQTKK
jgi:hypothetical protein